MHPTGEPRIEEADVRLAVLQVISQHVDEGVAHFPRRREIAPMIAVTQTRPRRHSTRRFTRIATRTAKLLIPLLSTEALPASITRCT